MITDKQHITTPKSQNIVKQKSALIQWYRGTAAILVVFFHFNDSTVQYFKTEFLGSFFSFGWAGVDLFFVLSGFIITYVHFNDLKLSKNSLIFLKKRLIRIYPNYWIIATLVLFGLLAFHGKKTHEYNIDLHSAQGLLYLLKCYLLVPLPEYFLGQAWTLCYELMFYGMFLVAILLGFKRSRYLLAGWVLMIFVNEFFLKTTNIYFGLILSTIVLEFIMGVLIACYIRSNGVVNINNWVFIQVIVILLAALKINDFYYVGPTDQRNLLTIILIGALASLVLVKITYLNEKRSYKLGILGKIGEASYSLYLIHALLLSIFIRLGVLLIERLHLSLNYTGFQILFIGIISSTIATSYAFFKFVEAPTLAFLNRIIFKRRNERFFIKTIHKAVEPAK